MTVPTTTSAAPSGDSRFQFGKNWSRFLSLLDDDRIAQAERSLSNMLGLADLHGCSFLDIGSGSGLFSLAAKRLGAERVRSFDYDRNSVACAHELKRRYFPDDADWTIEQGSVLDNDYLQSLGTYHIVYSWGVLHHTGALWKALANVTELVRPGGLLYIAIYNDQGSASQRWLWVKRLYNRGPAVMRVVLLALAGTYFGGRGLLGRLKRRLTNVPRGHQRERGRGMSFWYDLVDWVGGYPFEVATPEAVFDFCRGRGFALQRLKTVAGELGNNEFVFVRAAN